MSRTFFIAALSVLAAADAKAQIGDVPDWLIPAAERICAGYREAGALSPARMANLARRPIVRAAREPSGAVADRMRLVDAEGYVLNITTTLPGETRQRLLMMTSRPIEDTETAFLMLDLTGECALGRASLVEFDAEGRASALVQMRGPNLAVENRFALNPPVPRGEDPGGVRVAHIDTGVAYDLDSIAENLARDENGRILGYDFADDDHRPYDRDPGRPALFNRQHGTGVASVLIREAEDASLVPLRYPGDDAEALGRMPAEAARRGARIAMMPLGGYQPRLWEPLSEAMAGHPDILFVVSAGNDARDIDADPVYPAVLEIDNMLVVTSTEEDGHIARGANWGRLAVDLGVPAERIPILSPTGTQAIGSGSSYAVARVAALAARLAEVHPDWRAEQIKQAILERARPLPEDEERPLRHGWIADPR